MGFISAAAIQLDVGNRNTLQHTLQHITTHHNTLQHTTNETIRATAVHFDVGKLDVILLAVPLFLTN